MEWVFFFGKVFKILFSRCRSFSQNHLYAVASVQAKFLHSREIVWKNRSPFKKKEMKSAEVQLQVKATY